ncbi:hypothetical protein [Mesorhizobium sp. LSHC412B00]|uniref:hypothetical protein n=1 Tax=Mesorhizobium sp. LSHC412B00 TaxID=1287285 RepID=UPI0003CE5CF6|nr:hypothetical protein [Mesorhizobium sp. LSHC412B00]ESX89753.1 hypothetical protein X756_04865 [Mesorhizobium sp. LSHC412B00]
MRVFAAVAVTMPVLGLRLSHVDGYKIEFAAASAKSGNNGNGNGGGNGNGSGGNAGNGNANGKGKNGAGDNAPGSQAPSSQVNAAGDTVTVQGAKIQVVHRDGFSESIEAGRFTMKDPLGRTIVERAVRASDIARLKGL